MSVFFQEAYLNPRGEIVSSIICRKISRGRSSMPILSTGIFQSVYRNIESKRRTAMASSTWFFAYGCMSDSQKQSEMYTRSTVRVCLIGA